MPDDLATLAARVDRLEHEVDELRHGSRAAADAHAFALTQAHAEVAEFRAETTANFAELTTKVDRIGAALDELLSRIPPGA